MAAERTAEYKYRSSFKFEGTIPPSVIIESGTNNIDELTGMPFLSVKVESCRYSGDEQFERNSQDVINR
ncbi:hypothetical protein GCM10011325_26770 [Dyadobacter sediminis]|nr:hypothetical protein GCM10011325_26770 [Dyadobacter sediminis]